jgi:hypothetical protein
MCVTAGCSSSHMAATERRVHIYLKRLTRSLSVCVQGVALGSRSKARLGLSSEFGRPATTKRAMQAFAGAQKQGHHSSYIHAPLESPGAVAWLGSRVHAACTSQLPTAALPGHPALHSDV